MDLVALAFTLLGLGVVSRGYLLPGALLTVVPLIVLAIVLGRGRRSFLVLPFTFGSWFIVLPLAILATFLLQYQQHTRAELVPMGLALYYCGGISLVERRARYVPWASGLAWETATPAKRPVVLLAGRRRELLPLGIIPGACAHGPVGASGANSGLIAETCLTKRCTGRARTGFHVVGWRDSLGSTIMAHGKPALAC